MIPKINKILYATDLSKNSAYAFFYAVDMARKHNAGIVILHAIQPILPKVYYEGFWIEEKGNKIKRQEQEINIEEIKKKLQEFCRKTEVQIGAPCIQLVTEILVPVGLPVEEILNGTDNVSCDVIVLGTHSKGFLRQTFLGSVASDVLERARKPVFIIPLPSEKTKYRLG